MAFKTTVPVPTPKGIVQKAGTIINVESASERPSEYTLEDGTKLRIKLSLIQVVRLDGEYDAQGNPAYVTQTSQMISVDASGKKGAP